VLSGRRILRTVFALCALAAFATSPSFAQRADAPLIRIGAGLDVESTPVLYAQRAGLFARAGMRVEVVKITGGGTAIAAAIAGGALEIGKASTFALVTAHARGVPFVLLAPAASYSSDVPDIPLVVSVRSTMRSARELNGKTIGVVSLATTMRLATETWIDASGGDSKSVHFVELSPPAMPVAIEQGRIDGAPLSEPVFSEAMSGGKVRVLGYPYNALGKHFELADWFSSADWVAKNHDLAEKFARVMFDANAYVAAHESEMVPFIAAYVGIDPAVLAKMKNPERGTYFDPALIQPLIDGAARYKAIPKAFPASEMISDAALKAPK
jgi:ABC-type nitrate/sulfonate/bicarbonate transport system substrate-binding protein